MQQKGMNTLALVGFILAIVGIVCGLLGNIVPAIGIIGLVAWIGLVCNIVALVRFKPETENNKWMAIVGIILFVAQFVINIIIGVVYAATLLNK